MKREYRLTATAEKHLHDLAAWWAANRAEARVSIWAAFRNKISSILESPELGPIYCSDEKEIIRWLQLEGTPYKIYYSYEQEWGLNRVMAVWSGMRGHGPNLG